MVPAETLSQILTAQTERTLLAQESQQRVDKISDQTNKLVDQYRATLKEIDGLGSIKEVTQRILKVINL